MARTIYPVVLSGGAGTRLWPLSRALRPKQLIPLVSGRTMLQETLARVNGEGFAAPTVICNAAHRFMIAEQVRELGIEPLAIMLEPEGRNTGPAATAAAQFLAEHDTDAIMLLLPSDHVIGDVTAFRDAIATAIEAAAGGVLVTFGIPVARPETGYGYIRRGAAYDGVTGCYRIDRFIEKPELVAAETYARSEAYSWNSGIFLLPVNSFLEEVARLEPAMLAACRQAVASANRDLDFLRLASDPFHAAPAKSIDYAVMEHTDKGAVVAVEMAWSDVGSWSALWEISDKDDAGNVVSGEAFALDAHNCYVRAEGTLVAAIGIDNLVVVATDDVVLVVPRDRAQDVRRLVTEVEKAGRTEHYVHTQVFRPWGWYRRINSGPRYQVKEIVVNPGQRLSAQMHHHRAEHWVVVSGTAKVVREDTTYFITEDESTYIPHNTRHSLENPGRIPLRIIEVQSGPYLGEDDIVRFEDIYGRNDPETPTAG